MSTWTAKVTSLTLPHAGWRRQGFLSTAGSLWRSLTRLAIGSVPSVYFFYCQTHHVQPLWMWIALGLCVLPSAYSVRVIRNAVRKPSGFPELPPWLGNPTDMALALIASGIGISMVGLVLAAVGAYLELLVFLITHHFVTNATTAVALLTKVSQVAGAELVVAALPTAIAVLGLVLFLPVMLVHYAEQNRLTAVFELRAIKNRVMAHEHKLLIILFRLLIIGSVLNALVFEYAWLLSGIGFTIDVVAWTLIARACAPAAAIAIASTTLPEDAP